MRSMVLSHFCLMIRAFETPFRKLLNGMTANTQPLAIVRLELIHYIDVQSTKYKSIIPKIERLWQIPSSSASEQEFCLMYINQAGSGSCHILQEAACGAYPTNGDIQRTGTIDRLIESNATAPLQWCVRSLILANFSATKNAIWESDVEIVNHCASLLSRIVT